ncbi:MAG TPA: immunity 53 family protein [Bacteroidia bacterium]|jgi:hypothetical protein|nr:immunity 53 family protein [Bacteroidia bacterium]
MEVLKWIQNWYQSNCNGDWEHTYGISITTIDNPGWTVIINLQETRLENLSLDSGLIEKNENDWFIYEIENSTFIGNGDPTKLIFLLEKFKEIAENN